jgi:hypothetical protein
MLVALPLLRHRSAALGHRLRLPGALCSGAMAALSSAITNSNNATSLKISVAEELLSKLADPTILHTAAYIGGEWRLATSDATFQVCWAAAAPLARAWQPHGPQQRRSCAVPACCSAQLASRGRLPGRTPLPVRRSPTRPPASTSRRCRS